MFNLDCFNPYTTEVHREYVAVAGHGAWLAVLFLSRNKRSCTFWSYMSSVSECQINC